MSPLGIKVKRTFRDLYSRMRIGIGGLGLSFAVESSTSGAPQFETMSVASSGALTRPVLWYLHRTSPSSSVQRQYQGQLQWICARQSAWELQQKTMLKMARPQRTFRTQRRTFPRQQPVRHNENITSH